MLVRTSNKLRVSKCVSPEICNVCCLKERIEHKINTGSYKILHKLHSYIKYDTEIASESILGHLMSRYVKAYVALGRNCGVK